MHRCELIVTSSNVSRLDAIANCASRAIELTDQNIPELMNEVQQRLRRRQSL